MQLRNLVTFANKSDFWEDRALSVLSKFTFEYPLGLDDLTYICWRYGIKIFPLRKGILGDFDDDIKAFSTPSHKGKKGKIYLKENLSLIETKLLLAEEFCHIHIHCQSQLQSNAMQLNKNEAQAKRMAAYLLMPSFLLQNVNVSSDCQEVIISEIADYFQVTEELVYYRLEIMFLKNKLAQILC